jgi:hypothetical protein
MKNIFLLPTDKPSRLWLDKNNNKLHLDIESYGVNNQNIYITNDEEIKKGDWVIKISSLYKGGGIAQKYSFIDAQFEDIIFKKIILTTDPDLIADGVQAIDDEFLEWFVENPSCENVEIITTIVSNESTYKTNIRFESWRKEESKQKTLEEAAENYSRITLNKNGLMSDKQVNGFIAGAKWQSQRSYSEEEVLELLNDCRGENPIDINKWFEQYKKK